jgi:non-specific serine/threonine protein kinase
MGGCGKTHLALEASRAMKKAFPDGVYWVELSALQSHHSLLPIIAKTLGVNLQVQGEFIRPGERSNLEDELQAYLKTRELLLVLDSAEGIIEGLGCIPRLIEQAPKVKVLVTSRVRLNLICETIFPVQGMFYPERCDPEPLRYSSVQLLASTIHRWRPEYRITAQVSQYLGEICRLLQGIPLAILLAASWIGEKKA